MEREVPIIDVSIVQDETANTAVEVMLNESNPVPEVLISMPNGCGGAGGSTSWWDLEDKPIEFPPSGHDHIGESWVDALISNPVAHSHATDPWLVELLSDKADVDHQHDDRYLKLEGGEITGNLEVGGELSVGDCFSVNDSIAKLPSTLHIGDVLFQARADKDNNNSIEFLVPKEDTSSMYISLELLWDKVLAPDFEVFWQEPGMSVDSLKGIIKRFDSMFTLDTVDGVKVIRAKYGIVSDFGISAYS